MEDGSINQVAVSKSALTAGDMPELHIVTAASLAAKRMIGVQFLWWFRYSRDSLRPYDLDALVSSSYALVSSSYAGGVSSGRGEA